MYRREGTSEVFAGSGLLSVGGNARCCWVFSGRVEPVIISARGDWLDWDWGLGRVFGKVEGLRRFGRLIAHFGKDTFVMGRQNYMAETPAVF